MFKHISVFTLENKNDLDLLVKQLNDVLECPLVVRGEVGVNISHVKEGLEGPDFGDVIQILEFNTKEDMDNYPSSKEHMVLFKEGPKMKKVTAIDYEV